MSKIYRVIVICGLITASPALFAETNYALLQQQVISSDPVLKSLNKAQQAYEIKQNFSGKLNSPTFNVELDNLGNSKLKDLDGPTTLIVLSQEFPLSNKLSLRKQIASFDGDLNQFEIAKRQAELKADLRACMAQWYVTIQRAEIFSFESKLSARQSKILAERLKFGRVIPSDAQLSEALSSESKLRYQNEVKKGQFQKNLCSKFTSNLPGSALEVPLSFNFTDKISLAEQEAILNSKLRKAQFELALKEAKPDITLGVGIKNYQETNDKVFQVITSIPINFFNRNKGNIAIAQAEQMKAETQFAWLSRNSKIELKSKSIEISNLIDAIHQYDQSVLPAINESLRIAEMGYQAGKNSLFEFNSIKQVWLDKQLARYDLWFVLQTEIAELERNYMTPLDQE